MRVRSVGISSTPNKEGSVEERLEVLEAIERGDITVQEGLARLEGGGGAPAAPASTRSAPPTAVRPWLVRVIWQSVFGLGVALVVAGGVLVAAYYGWAIPPAWQVVGWVLLGLGVVVMGVGWWMRTARWLAIRVREEDGTKVNLAFPIPLGLVYWALRMVRPFVPQLQDVPIEEMVVALEETLRSDEPFFVDVHDEEDGDHVQVYFA
jgi:hypothetical protein